MLKIGKTSGKWFAEKKKTKEYDKPSRMWALLKCISGPIVILAAMGLTQMIYLESTMRIDITGVLVLMIIYSFSIGGVWIGGISVGLTLVYAYLLSIEGAGSLGGEPDIHLMINHFIMYGVGGFVGLFHHLFGSKYKALKVMQADLARAEQHALMMVVQSKLDGKIVKVLPSFCKLVGYTEKELLKMNFKDITHPEDRQKETKLFEQILKGRIKSFELEKRYIAKDGDIKWVYLNVSLITAKNGKPKGFLGYVKDITELKQTEQALKESEERYRSVIDISPIAIFIHDENRFDFINQEGIRLLGAKSADEVLKRDVFTLIERDDDRKLVKESMEFMMKQGGSSPLMERKIQRIDGSLVDVEVIITTIPYGDRAMFLGFVRDISARKQAEALQKNIEENTKLLSEAIEYDIVKTEFFANISHELRTPLNVILGTQQLLQIMGDQCVDAEKSIKFRRYLHVMKQNGNRLLRLVNNLIDITKIDSGYFQIHLVNHDIVSVVENITLSVTDYVEGKGMTLTFDTDVEEKIMACDPDSMERIMLNLLSNAVKFSRPDGEIQVHIHDKGEAIQITVKDTGIGIPLDKQQLIFERFRQVDKSLTRNHEGSGIGLSLVKSLVEMQGGKIILESEEGKGSGFIMTFPVGTVEQEEQVREGSMRQSLVERVNVEFSDIYSYHEK